MLTVEKQRKLDRWRSGGGVCYVCGQCLGAPLHQRSTTTAEKQRDEEAAAGGFDDAVDNDGLLLNEECPVRLCLLRFNMLGVHQDSHVVVSSPCVFF